MEAASNSNGTLASKAINIAIGIVIIALLVSAGVLVYMYVHTDNTSAGERALEQWQETVKDNPNNSLARANLGAAYMDMGMTDDAIRELKVALDQEPKGFVYMQKLAEAYRVKGDLPAAIDMYKQAAELTPKGDKNEPFYWIAQSYFDLGDMASAKDYIQQSIADYDINWNARFLFGQILEGEGDKAGAKLQYEGAAKFNPGNPDLQAALKRVSS